jgi:hypothetical protein
MDMILGLLMMAGNIFCSVYVFWAWRESPKWLTITAGVMNVLFFLGAMAIAME